MDNNTRRGFLKRLGLSVVSGAVDAAGKALGVPAAGASLAKMVDSVTSPTSNPLTEAVKSVTSPSSRASALDYSLMHWMANLHKGSLFRCEVTGGDPLTGMDVVRFNDMIEENPLLNSGILDREEELRALKPSKDDLKASLKRIRALTQPALSADAARLLVAEESIKERQTELICREVVGTTDEMTASALKAIEKKVCATCKLDYTGYSADVIEEARQYTAWESFKGMEQCASTLAPSGNGATPAELVDNSLDKLSNIIELPEAEYRAELEKLRASRTPVLPEKSIPNDAVQPESRYEYVSPWERMVQNDDRWQEKLRLRADELDGKNSWSQGF